MNRERLPLPAKIDSELFLDEAIWGNRLHNEQTPWMVLLELLSVLASQVRDGTPFCEDPATHRVAYTMPWRLALRTILFSNPGVEEVAQQHADDAARWDAWLARMRKDKSNTHAPDLSYLRTVFRAEDASDRSFADFVRVVTLLRSTALEGDSNKRWTSKFVFPYGPAALFPDLGIKRDGMSTDRRFFGRTGELAYLMLCRSGRGPEIFRHLERSVFATGSPWNQLLTRLQPREHPKDTSIHTGYLPYAHLPDYDQLADDLLAVLRLQLPGYDALPHLVHLLGLHLVLYYLRRAAEWVPEDPPPHFVLEIIAPKRTTVRDLAVESFQLNNQRGERAVDRFLSTEVAGDPRWRAACAIDDEQERRAAIYEVFHATARWRQAGQDDQPRIADPAEALSELREFALQRHRHHVAPVHAAYAQAIGLASRRGTRRTRYAPSDHLLQTLVLTVVPRRMDFREFLVALWERYRMVVGYDQARQLLRDGSGDSDKRAFDDNAHRLEMRLASLGLLRRLSDACAYVENPMEVSA